MQHSSLYTPSRIMDVELLSNESFEAQIQELSQAGMEFNDVSRKECIFALKELVRRRWIPVSLVPFLKCSVRLYNMTVCVLSRIVEENI